MSMRTQIGGGRPVLHRVWPEDNDGHRDGASRMQEGGGGDSEVSRASQNCYARQEEERSWPNVPACPPVVMLDSTTFSQEPHMMWRVGVSPGVAVQVKGPR